MNWKWVILFKKFAGKFEKLGGVSSWFSLMTSTVVPPVSQRVEVKCCVCSLLNYWVAKVSALCTSTSSLDKNYLGGSGDSLPFYFIVL